jgi:hypothetical protein
MGDTYNSAAEAEADRAQHKASRSIRVELEPIGLTEQGQRFRVTERARRNVGAKAPTSRPSRWRSRGKNRSASAGVES